jgi:pyridoxamine 5'-phosphate oxidase
VPDPLAEFRRVFDRSAENAPYDPVAVTLATASRDGRPSARIVLLRGVDDHGFVFFTNYQSRKASEIEDNPHAALCCYWPWLDEQVRVEGLVERATAAESDAYFASRPRGSQIGAWASAQSRPLESREVLEQSYHDTDARLTAQAVPRPPHWGGYRIVPERIEFWHAGTYRLHNRVLYTREGNDWRRELLYP